MAASARSCHSASLSGGSNSSASCTSGAASMVGRPSALLRVFCSSTALRTPGTPPRSTCSAMGRWASGSAARAASRCSRRGRRRLGLGLGGRAGLRGRSGRPSPRPRFSPPRRPPPSRPSRRPRPPRPSRSPPRPPRPSRSPRPRPRLGTSWVVTPPWSRPEPSSSRRSGSLRSPLAGSTEVISIPSTKNSASTRSSWPTAAPSGSNDAAMTPFGSRAPTARQVQVSSSLTDVSSISIRRDIGAIRYPAEPDPPQLGSARPARRRHRSAAPTHQR